MKKLLITCVLFCFVLSSCEIPTTTKKKKTTRRTVSTKSTPRLGVVGVLSSDEHGGIKVNAGWMKRYRALEKKYGEIPADGLIWQEGNDFWINHDVSNHFSEMKIADSQKKKP